GDEVFDDVSVVDGGGDGGGLAQSVGQSDGNTVVEVVVNNEGVLEAITIDIAEGGREVEGGADSLEGQAVTNAGLEGQVVDVGVIVAVEVQAEATDITGDANVGLEGGGGGGARVVVVGGTDIEGPGVVDREGVAGDEVDLVVDDASNGVLGEGGPDDAV